MSDPIPFKIDASLERKQLAEGAQNLLDDKAFTAAILALRKQWFAEWQESTSDKHDKRLKAQIKALTAIPQQLQIFCNDQKMVDARKR